LEPPDNKQFVVLMIVSEVVITAVAMIGAYLIFKKFLDKQKKDNPGQSDSSSGL
jgi:uncharacterized protein YneF (UPF0154 family)